MDKVQLDRELLERWLDNESRVSDIIRINHLTRAIEGGMFNSGPFDVDWKESVYAWAKRVTKVIDVDRAGVCPFCHNPLTDTLKPDYCGTCGTHIAPVDRAGNLDALKGDPDNQHKSAKLDKSHGERLSELEEIITPDAWVEQQHKPEEQEPSNSLVFNECPGCPECKNRAQQETDTPEGKGMRCIACGDIMHREDVQGHKCKQ